MSAARARLQAQKRGSTRAGENKRKSFPDVAGNRAVSTRPRFLDPRPPPPPPPIDSTTIYDMTAFSDSLNLRSLASRRIARARIFRAQWIPRDSVQSLGGVPNEIKSSSHPRARMRRRPDDYGGCPPRELESPRSRRRVWIPRRDIVISFPRRLIPPTRINSKVVAINVPVGSRRIPVRKRDCTVRRERIQYPSRLRGAIRS